MAHRDNDKPAFLYMADNALSKWLETWNDVVLNRFSTFTN